jgi:molybdopterin-guanine dinucleotide biosynthesis protein A
MKKFAAVLLAGGRSSRMGTNKAFIKYDGMPMWRFQIDKLVKLDPDQLFLSVQQGAEFSPGPWRFVHDRSAELGPLGGLEAALWQAHSEFLLTLAVDMPGMTVNFLRELLEQSRSAGTVPLLDGFYCGAAAVYPVKVLPLVEKILVGKDRSFQRLIGEAIKSGMLKAKEIPASQAALFANWNSPEDCGGGVGAADRSRLRF